MHTKFLIIICLFSAVAAFGQEPEQTLFHNTKLSGGFCAPIFTYGEKNGQSMYGAGGGIGLVYNQFFAGLFGMGETYATPQLHDDHLSLGYGGLWMGYVVPSRKVVHLYTSLKLAGGAAGIVHFDKDWDVQDDWTDAVFVAVPEAGLELNLTRWFRISGSAGYRLVSGFDGWQNFGKKDLNAPVFALTFRFGWFAARR